jgi:U1 small nuclear ribonucleoprotein C
MPKYFCEYCGIYLTHSSPGGRNQHSRGRKHINNKIEYYSQILYEFQQGVGANLIKMTSHILNRPKEVLDNPNQNYTNYMLNDNDKIKIDPNTTIYNPGEYPLKKAIVHIPGEMPLTVPLAYVPNIPINEKIMKAIPTKMQPQFKKIAQIQEDISKKENINFEEGDNDKNNNNINNKNKSHSKNILENLKKMKYCYNDPNPDNNEHLITDLLKNEDDEDETENKK